jgi:uncharacterized damage-inducible protein DinB
MNLEAVRELYDYTYIIFDRVWDCILQLTDELFTQPIDYSTGSIRNHMVPLAGIQITSQR